MSFLKVRDHRVLLVNSLKNHGDFTDKKVRLFPIILGIFFHKVASEFIWHDEVGIVFEVDCDESHDSISKPIVIKLNLLGLSLFRHTFNI